MKFTTGIKITSKHYVNDLFVISLAYALLYVAEDLAKNDIKKDGVIQKEFNYPAGFKEMLDKHIAGLKNELFEFMQWKEHLPIAGRVKTKVKTRLPDILKLFQNESVSLEILAMYLLFYNFVKREIMHRNFKQFTDESKYSLVVDTLDAAGFSLFDKIKMNNLAKAALERL